MQVAAGVYLRWSMARRPYLLDSEPGTVCRIAPSGGELDEFGRGGGCPPRAKREQGPEELRRRGSSEKRDTELGFHDHVDGEDPLLEMSYAGIGDLGHVATASVRALTCTDVLQPRCTRLAYTPRVSFVYTLSQIAPAQALSAVPRYAARRRRLLQARWCAVQQDYRQTRRYAIRPSLMPSTLHDRIPTGANRNKGKKFTRDSKGVGDVPDQPLLSQRKSILAWIYPGPLRAGPVFLLPAIWRWTI